MTKTSLEDPPLRLHVRLGGRERVLFLPESRIEQARLLARTVLHEPFRRRAWAELAFFALASLLEGWALVFVGVTMAAGALLLVTFVGLFIVGCAVRGSRGFGRLHRRLAGWLIGVEIPEPAAFTPRGGVFGWLQAALRDRVGWRAMAYTMAKIPLVVAGTWFAFSVWFDAFSCLLYPIWGAGRAQPAEFGVVTNVLHPGFFWVGSGFVHGMFVVATGVLLFFAAPWPMRLVVAVDRHLMRALLSPDETTERIRSLEHARAQTVDASAEQLRMIERDLHDGTQAQLVAIAMRLGQVREGLSGGTDAAELRQLVEDAYCGAKEAIKELRDLVRGIHPPALDTGLENALSTLAARSSVPTDLSVSLEGRPTAAIEAIAYFCVAELLANVAQHAEAARASVRCTQHGERVRLVVRDDGRGGAAASRVCSSSSGLSGLTERVRAVDGDLTITSPPGGPTVITIDLPLGI